MMLVLVILLCVETVVLGGLVAELLKMKYDGSIVFTETEEKKTFTLEFDKDPSELDQQKRVVLRMQKIPSE